jgi:crotonobetainyl-CoA:carnitine CoA-transferase CaiB-like acyl-CoA transferase
VTTGWQQAARQPVADLGLDPSRIESVAVTGSAASLVSSLAVADCAVASVGATLVAAARLVGVRRGGAGPAVELDAAHTAVAFRSEIDVSVDNNPIVGGFGPLSRFFPTADGFVRTHANYPWHRAALFRALGATEDADVGPALAVLEARDAEARIVGAGGIAAAVRTSDDWRESPPGRAVGLRPLIDLEAIGDAPRRREADAGTAPASGLRVLDLTRVLAGPTATRMLAALGADVLRLDPPDRPELAFHRIDALLGKRSALLDAETTAGRQQLDALVAGADVVVCGYRPASLDRLGLHPQALAYRHPGVVFASVSAWGTTGPWGYRRGFDSIVQAAAGISLVESRDGVTPGALPCQVLDHASGYLLAAGVLAAVARQYEAGGTLGVWVSLARTAQWLMSQPVPAREAAAPDRDPRPWLVDLPGGVRVVAPPGRLDGHPLAWPRDRGHYGADEPRW